MALTVVVVSPTFVYVFLQELPSVGLFIRKIS